MEGSDCNASTFSVSSVSMAGVSPVLPSMAMSFGMSHMFELETHGLYRKIQVTKNRRTIKQLKASMMANGRFGQQISWIKAFKLAPTGAKTVFKTTYHCRGISNTMSMAC